MKIEEIIAKQFETGFAKVKETLEASVEERVAPVATGLKSVQEQLSAIKAAGVRGASSGVSFETRQALGNSVKEIFHVKVAADAPRLVMKADEVISGSTTGDGEELMHTELNAGILRLAEDYGTLMSRVRRFNSRERSYKIVFSSLATDHGAYDTEAASRESDKETFTDSELALYKWRKIIGVSKEALEDSAPEDLASFLIESLSMHYGLFVDAQIVSVVNANTSIPKRTLGGIVEVSLTYDDLVKVTTLTKTATLGNSAFYMHKKIWATVRTLKDDNGRPLVEINRTPVLQANGIPVKGQPAGYIDGYPVYLSDALTSAYAANAIVVWFGDLAAAAGMIVRKDFAVESDSSEKFSSDIVLLKGTARNRITTLNAEALAFVKCAAS